MGFGNFGRRGGGGGGGTRSPSIAFSVPVISQPEGNSGATAFTWTLTLDRAGLLGNVDFTWAVTGSGSNPASASDFVGGVLPSGSGTFTSGQVTKTITVQVAGDAAIEPDESFIVTANATMTLAMPSKTATGNILNDDTGPPPGKLDFSATTNSGLLALILEDF